MKKFVALGESEAIIRQFCCLADMGARPWEPLSVCVRVADVDNSGFRLFLSEAYHLQPLRHCSYASYFFSSPDRRITSLIQSSSIGTKANSSTRHSARTTDCDNTLQREIFPYVA